MAVFVSGGGSNLEALIDALKGREDICICLVLASREGVYALERARLHGIPSCVVSRKGISHELYDELIIRELEHCGADYVVLAGFLSILGKGAVKAYEGKIINVHPSLIPKFCGKGMYGMRVHKAVLAAGERESGATVHFVDEGTDTGRIIFQEKVPVFPDDTPETLAARVLEVEHVLLPKAAVLLAEGKLEEGSYEKGID